MKLIAGRLVVLLFALLAVSASASAETNVNFFLGQKLLDGDDWAPAEDQMQFGLLVDHAVAKGAINLAFDVLFARGEGRGDIGNGQEGDIKSKTSEFDVGVRKIFKVFDNMRPYVGGGIGFLTAERCAPEPPQRPFEVCRSDATLGFWINTGFYFTIAKNVNIGVDGRISAGSVTLGGAEEFKAGGPQYGLIVGYHWD